MKQLIQKYQVGGKNWVEKYYYPNLNKVFDFLKNQPAKFLDENIMEPVIGVHPYNFILNRLQRRATNTDFPAIIRYIPSYMAYDYINEKVTKQNNQNNKTTQQPDQIKKQNTESNNKQRLNPNFHKKGGIIKAAQGWRVNNNRIIVTLGGTDFFVDPEAFTVDDEGFSNAAYIDSKGNRHRFRLTEFDTNRLKRLGVNYKSGKKIIKSTYNPNNPSNSSTDEVNKSSPAVPPTQVAPSTGSDYSGVMDFIYQQVPWLKGFTPREGGTYKFSNGQWSEVQNGSAEAPIKQETPAKTDGQQPEAPTYESLVGVNTASMNGNINSGYFRKQFRKAFNKALLDGTIYGVNNPNGTQVFDSNAVMDYENGNPIYATAANIIQRYGLDGKISRRDMRMLRKDIIGNQNQTRMNNTNNFLGITSPAVTSQAAEEIAPVQPINNNVYDPTGKFQAVQNGTYGNGGYDPLEDESIKSKIQFATQ